MSYIAALAVVTDAALNDRHRAADRIAAEIATNLGGTGYAGHYRPSLLEVVNERRIRAGQPIIETMPAPLLPPGGQPELDAMRKRYTKRAKRNARKGNK